MRGSLAGIVSKVATFAASPESEKLAERLRKHREALARLEEAEVRDAARLTEASAGVAAELAESILDGPHAIAVRELRTARKARASDMSSLRLAIERLEQEHAEAVAREQVEAAEVELRQLAAEYGRLSAEAVEALAVARLALGRAMTVEGRWLDRNEAWHKSGGAPIATTGLRYERILERSEKRLRELEPRMATSGGFGGRTVEMRVPVIREDAKP